MISLASTQIFKALREFIASDAKARAISFQGTMWHLPWQHQRLAARKRGTP